MATSNALRDVFEAGRPLIEQWLDVAEQIAALRNVATERGLDWSQVKQLLKAQIQDERDGSGEGKRVRRIVEKAEFASAYADMLGLAKMNEKSFSDAPVKVEPKLVEMIVQGVQADIGRKALTTALDAMIGVEESREDALPATEPQAPQAPAERLSEAETAAPFTDDDLEIPACLRRHV